MEQTEKSAKNVGAAREKRGEHTGVIALFVNLLLFAAKLAGGLLSGSISLCADAVNNLSDAAGAVVTAFGFRVAAKPADKKHPYGHARSEYLASLVLAVFMLFAAFELGKSSVERILQPRALELSVPIFVLTLLCVVAKLGLFLFYRKNAERIESRTLSTAATDSLFDAIATFLVLCGMLSERFFALRADAYLGLAVCFLMLVSGIRILLGTLDPLLGAPPDPKLIARVRRQILAHSRVLGLHDLVVHNYGAGRLFITVHLEVDAATSLSDAHELADVIEREFLQTENIMLVTHIDPVSSDDILADEIKNALCAFLKEVSPALSVHDFRAVRSARETTFCFDLLVPDEFSVPDSTLRELIDGFLAARDPHYRAALTIDRGYLPSL